MPPPSVCAKCRQIPAAEGDSWCSGCSAWEFVGKELTASWDSQGARLLASDLIVGAARQIKALRSLSSGLTRETGGKGAAGGSRAAAERAGEDKRESLPRRRSVPSAPPPPPPKEEEQSDEFEEETEEETEGEGHREVAPLGSGGHKRPPEPDGPPPNKERRGDHRREHRGENRDRRRDKEKSGKKRRGPGSRGGRKHQKLYRLAHDPFLNVHRKPSSSFWDLPTHGREHLESGHLGR